MRRGGRFPKTLAACAEQLPIVTHGLTLSLGGTSAFRPEYLSALATFAREVGSPWHSDHLCFGSVDGTELHELLPLPLNREFAEHVATRVMRAQDALGLPMAVENISYYAHPGAVEMNEAEFVTEVVARSGCSLLLDVNNVYVNSRNHGFDPREMISRMPLDRVVQIHVAGHDESDPELLVDTHAEPIRDEVYALLEFTLEKTGPRPVLLERDDHFPSWDELTTELRNLDRIVRAARAGKSSS